MRQLIHALLIFAALPLALANAGSPFDEGTKTVRLSSAERESLSYFIEATRESLNRAIEDARGAALADAEQIYLDAIIGAVIASQKIEPRPELLTRYALNQGLEIAYGVPSADGTAIDRAGTLPIDARYLGLRVVVLEDSIRLALAFLPEDQKAIEASELIDLPFMQLAYTRLKTARLWLAAVFSETTRYTMNLRVLEHWLAAAGASEQSHRAKVASEILEVERVLSKERPKRVLKDSKKIARRVRELNKLIRRILETEVAATSGLRSFEALADYEKNTLPQMRPNEGSDGRVLYRTSNGYERSENSGVNGPVAHGYVAGSLVTGNGYGGRGEFEVLNVDSGSGIPTSRLMGFRLRADHMGRATRLSAESMWGETFRRETSTLKSTLVKSWEALTFLRPVLRYARNEQTGWSEKTVGISVGGLRGAVTSINEKSTFSFDYEIGIGEFAKHFADSHKSFQLRLANLNAVLGYERNSGLGISDTFRAGLAFDNYGPDSDGFSDATMFELENEMAISFPKNLYASWLVRWQSREISQGHDNDDPRNKKSDTQHWFNLGVKY